AMMLMTLIASLTSCTRSPREMLTGEYEVSAITTDKKMSAEDMQIWQEAMEPIKKSARLSLKCDGKMQHSLNGITKIGTWEVYGEEGEEGEPCRLKLIMEDKSTVNMEIHDLTSDGFVVVEHDESSHSTSTLTYSKIK
ncbi:MAG: hypothetical protein II480_11955, partial [Bacteroidales bacterium]|nr:hypothetical protein [Bacteroidales bacterium]